MKYFPRSTETGLLYFYIHFVTETVCFYTLNELYRLPVSAWIIAFAYDALAFVPQSLIGYYRDEHKSLNLSIIGLVFLIISTILTNTIQSATIILLFLCIGNALIHVEGAEVTIRSADGRMTPSAVFVGGGSFGVITGKLCSMYGVPYYAILFLIVSAVPFVLLSDAIKEETDRCSMFDYANIDNKARVIIYSALIVIIRGYMGYGIPTSWNKSVLQNIIFFFAMGLGKCLGGILIDKIGIRKTALLSIIGSVPFLLFGDRIMILSIIGVAFFSMTMAITLALLVSVLPRKVGLAFGITTIGLFLGSVPVFFFKIKNFVYSVIMIITLSFLCVYMVLRVIKNDDCN